MAIEQRWCLYPNVMTIVIKSYAHNMLNGF